MTASSEGLVEASASQGTRTPSLLWLLEGLQKQPEGRILLSCGPPGPELPPPWGTEALGGGIGNSALACWGWTPVLWLQPSLGAVGSASVRISGWT